MLTADPSIEAFNTYVVDPDALTPEGEPRIILSNAVSVDGALQAGPGDFSFELPLGGEPAVVTLEDTVLTGDLSLDGEGGLDVQGGYISGVLSEETFNAILDVVPAEFRDLAAGLIQPDVDTNNDGAADAYSMCLSYTAAAAILQGYPVEAE